MFWSAFSWGRGIPNKSIGQGEFRSPLYPTTKSIRVQVSHQGQDFRFILTGEKWFNELLPEGTPNRGGGGAIDFVRHLTGLNFVQAVKICLDASMALNDKHRTRDV